MARNIPGLNNQLYTAMLAEGMKNPAELEYKQYKSMVSPLQKKLMWPSTIATLFSDPIYARPLLEKFGSKKLASTVEESGILGAAGGLGVLLPRTLSEGLKSRRLAYERSYAKQLGAVGSASRLLDSLSSIRSLMTLPGYMAQTLGYGSGVLKHTPRIEHFLTGRAKEILTGTPTNKTGGILSSIYGGTKDFGNFITGNKISEALAAGTKKGGIAGALSTGTKILDKGVSNLLSSPSGVMLGLMGAQVGLGIYKSVKMSKLRINQQAPDKFARRFYNSSASQNALNKISALASSGKIDPQTLSFMILQVQLSELQRLNMQLAGFRGEYHSENDLLRQEKEKGTESVTDTYGTKILGEDNRSLVSKFLDWLESGLHTVKTKYDPIAQLVNFGVGLLSGKLILPKQEASRIAEMYGFSSEKKMLKERAQQFGIPTDQMKLLHMSSKQILQMAPTYESKMLAILSASYDVQRAIASEATTIRTGMGFEKNIMYAKDKGLLSRIVSGISNAITNIPGLNAIGNIITGAGKLVSGVVQFPSKIFEKGGEILGKTRDFLFGESYSKLKDKDEWAKAAGLYISSQDKAFDFIANGLPNQVERIRSVLFDIYYVQEEMLREMGGEATKADERLVWSPIEKRYITVEAAQVLEESQRIQLEATREKAFREGPLGKLLFAADFLTTKVGKDFFADLAKVSTVEKSIKRMHGAEKLFGRAEIALTGEPATFETTRAMTEILSDISSIKSTVATAVQSLEEIESERQLERMPEGVGWLTKSAISVAGTILGLLLGGPAGFVAAGASTGAFLKARQQREKEIREGREREIGSRNIIERSIELQEEYFNKPVEERIAFELLKKENQTLLQGFQKVTKQDQIIEQLKIIASYLGDDAGSVYELLEPGRRYAEVTLVFPNGKPVFTMPSPPPQKQLPSLKEIEDSSESVLVGEEGPEILVPGEPGMIIPNKDIKGYASGGLLGNNPGDFGIFSKIYQKLVDIFSVNKETLDIELDKEKKNKKDERQLTMHEKLQALKERMKEKAQNLWQSKVIELLSLRAKTDEKEAKTDGKTGGFFSKIWDFLKDNKNIATSVGLGAFAAVFKEQLKLFGRGALGIGLTAGQWGKVVSGGAKAAEAGGEGVRAAKAGGGGIAKSGYAKVKAVLGDVGDLTKSGYDRVKSLLTKDLSVTKAVESIKTTTTMILKPVESVIGFIGKAFEPIIKLLKPLARVVGRLALPLQIVMTSFDFISDTMEGYKEGGLWGAIKGFIAGPMKDDISTTLGQVGKWAGAGMLAGLAGGPIGVIAGSLIGAAFGSIISMIKSVYMSYTTDGLWEAIKQAFLGDKEGGLKSALKTMGPYALAGFVAGSFIPIIGNVAGALIGASIGGIIGWLGQFKITNFISDLTNAMSEWGPNPYIISLFEKDGMKYAPMFAKGLSTIPIVGPLIGGVIGSVVDVIFNLWGSIKKIPSIAGNWIKSGFKNILPDSVYNALFGESSIPALTTPSSSTTKGSVPEERSFWNRFKDKFTHAKEDRQRKNDAELAKRLEKQREYLEQKSQRTKFPKMKKHTVANISIPTGNIAEILQQASIDTGAPLSIMQKIAYAESKFDPNAKAPGTSASGLFQFTRETWNKLIRKKGRKYGFPSNISPFNPVANAYMGGEFINENINTIKNSVLVPPPNPADVYAAHFLGASGAKRLFREIKKNPNIIASKIFPRAANANPNIFYENGNLSKPRTIGQVYSIFAQKMAIDPSSVLSKAGTELATSGYMTALTKQFDKEKSYRVSDAENFIPGPVTNPAQTTAIIKEYNRSMSVDVKKPKEVSKEDLKQRKEDTEKRLAELKSKTSEQPTEKVSSLSATPSVARNMNVLGTSISGPIDELLEKLFNHIILNDLNTSYPINYIT